MRSCMVESTEALLEGGRLSRRVRASREATDRDIYLYFSEHAEGVFLRDEGMHLTPLKAHKLGAALVQMASGIKKEKT